MRNPIPIQIPQGSEISNYLFEEMDSDDLIQDLVTVRLPSGFFVEAGWLPEHDPSGCFFVRAFRDAWEIDPILVTTIEDTVACVERLCRTYAKRGVARSDSQSTRISAVSI